MSFTNIKLLFGTLITEIHRLNDLIFLKNKKVKLIFLFNF